MSATSPNLPQRHRQRLMVVVGVGAAMLIGAGTYATLLQVTANDHASGTASVPACQPLSEPMRVQADDPVYDASARGFVTRGITVSNINQACQSGQLGLYATAFDVNSRALKSIGPNLIDASSVHINFPASGWVRLEEIHAWGFAVHPMGLLAPSGLVGAAASSTSVNLTWTAPSAPAGYEITDYTIEYSSDDGQNWTEFVHAPSTDPQATITGLTAGQTYLFRVRSENSAGAGESATSSPVHLVAPGQVDDLVATPASSTSVEVTWTAPTAIPGAAITDYTVEYSSNGGSSWDTFNDGTNAQTSVTVTGLTVSTSYVFRITAVNAVGAGPATTSDTALTETSPSEPRFVAGDTPSSGNVHLTWTAPVDNGGAAITDYVVQYAVDDGEDDWVTFDDGTSTDLGATVTGLSNGTAYYFRVRAVNSKGTGPASVSQPRATPAGDPSVPRSVTLASGQDNILASWNEPASSGGVPIVSYRASTPLGNGNTASCTTTGLSCRITGLTIDTDYTVTVTATNAAGRTSTATSDIRTAAATAPGSPTSVAGTPQNTAVRVTWEAPGSDGGAVITSYTITSTPQGKTCTSSGALACVVADLTNGTPYTFTVTATNSAGTSAPSAASSAVTPAGTPGAPTSVTAVSPGTSGEIDLSWTAPSSNGGSAITDYLIQYSTDDGGTWSDVVREASTNTSAVIADLDDNRDYRFRVVAINGVGSGPASVPSDPVAPTFTSGAPGPVSAITTSAIDDAVILDWTAPAYLGASVTEYEVQYKCVRVPGSRQDHCDDTAPYEQWSDWYQTNSTDTQAQIGREGINRGAPDTKEGELFDGNDYWFRVRALIDTTEGVAVQTSAVAQPQEGCVPNAPTGLAGTVNSTTSIGLSWTRDPGAAPVGNPPVGCLGEPIDPRTHYKLSYQSSADGSTWSEWSTPATDTASMDTTYAFTGLTPSTWYRFRVQEWPDDDNRSAWSLPSAGVRTTDVITVPGHPTNVSGEAGDTTADVSWTAPAGTGGAPIDQYRVSAYTDAAGTQLAGVASNPRTLASGATFTGLTNGSAYYFRVEAHNSAGWSAAADPSEAVTPRTVPGAPGKPAADPTAGDATVSLSWAAPGSTGGSDVTNYLVQYSSDAGATWATFGHAATTDTGVVVTGLATGRGYVFRVAAVNAAGTGAWSAVSDSAIPYSVPSAPTSLVGTPQSGLAAGATTTYVDLAWAAPLDNGGSAITGYRVQYSVNDGGTWTSSSAGSTSARVSDLPVSTTLRLRVRAVTAATRASDSGYTWATLTLTTATPPAPAPAPPNAVTGLAAAPGDGLVALSWTASTTTGAAVTGYSVRYSSNGGSTWSAPTTTAATSLAVTGLTNSTAYRFEVVPTSSSGNGPATTVDATPVAPSKLVPQAVRGLAATPGVLIANLTWTEPQTSDAYAAVTGYVVQRSTNGNSWTTIATLDASKRSYLADGLKGGTTYSFRVFATSAAGDGAIVRSVTAVPIAVTNYQTITGTATWTDGSVLLQSGTSVLSKDTLTDVTVTATGSMATSPVGYGYGIWVRSTVTNSQISGYCFQVDPGLGNQFVLRWWTNGKERGAPWAQVKFPAGFDPNAPHVVSVSVLSGVLTGVVDGVTVMTTTLPTQSETVNGVTFTPITGGRYGFRTWYPTIATVRDITVVAY